MVSGLCSRCIFIEYFTESKFSSVLRELLQASLKQGFSVYLWSFSCIYMDYLFCMTTASERFSDSQ